MEQLIPTYDFESRGGLLVVSTTCIAEALGVQEDELLEIIDERMGNYESFLEERGLHWRDITRMDDCGDILNLTLEGFRDLLQIPLLSRPNLKPKYKQIVDSYQSAASEMNANGKVVTLTVEGY